MHFCCLCGMGKTDDVHLCTAEVVSLLSRVPSPALA